MIISYITKAKRLYYHLVVIQITYVNSLQGKQRLFRCTVHLFSKSYLTMFGQCVPYTGYIVGLNLTTQWLSKQKHQLHTIREAPHCVARRWLKWTCHQWYLHLYPNHVCSTCHTKTTMYPAPNLKQSLFHAVPDLIWARDLTVYCVKK